MFPHMHSAHKHKKNENKKRKRAKKRNFSIKYSAHAEAILKQRSRIINIAHFFFLCQPGFGSEARISQMALSIVYLLP